MQRFSSLGALAFLQCAFGLIVSIAVLIACRPLQAQAEGPLDEARTHLARHENSAAELAIRKYLQDHPDSADAHFLLAYTLFSEKKASDSLNEYTMAAKYRKPAPNDLMAIGADYVLLKDNEDADYLFLKVTHLEPANELAWYYLGRARFYENRYDDAVKAFTVCLQLKPKDIPAETNLGLAFQQQGRDQDAITAYRQAIEWEKESSDRDGQPYLDLGLLFRKQQHADQSLPFLVSAAELEPNNPETHFELAKTYNDLQKYADAERQLRIVLSIAPDASAAHYILGRVLKAEGRSAEADEEFTTTSKLNGGHSTKELTNFNFPQSSLIDSGKVPSQP